MLFSETQRFRQWWLWVLLIAISVSLVFSFSVNYNSATGWSLRHFSYSVGTTIVILGLLLLIYSIRLQTSITETGLSYRFTLLQGKPTQLLWSDIATAEIRQYKPGKEYGGWGIRYGKDSGKAINVSGNIGLQLITKKGTKLLIGTNKKDELASVMEQLYKKGLVKQGSEANIKERH